MQSILQTLFSTLASNEFFQDIKFLFVTGLDSLRIVKNITLVIGEHKGIIDAVLAPLASCLEATKEKNCSY
jgi:hypothetical protein